MRDKRSHKTPARVKPLKAIPEREHKRLAEHHAANAALRAALLAGVLGKGGAA